jgi:C1A family cysteine protease
MRCFNCRSISLTSILEAGAALPAHFDWRDRDIVPDVRDQGACNSCWAFGTVGVMESVLLMNGAADSDLSEQFLVSEEIPGA